MVKEKLLPLVTKQEKEKEEKKDDKYKHGTQFQTGLPIIYMRELDPDYCIAFDSPEGRKLFKSAMLGDYMNIYFKLAQNFRTQDNSMMCSSGSIAMVLNALGVDPHRMWKYPWRWYDEYMLCSCIEPDTIIRDGMHLSEYACVCRQNKLQVETFAVSSESSVQQFRESVRQSCSSYDTVLVANYSRAALGQTGTGHYSPIGGYNEEEDKVLIMDIARFKLPPHWVSVEVFHKAMASANVNRVGDTSDMPRGYVMLKKQEVNPSITVRYPNNTKTVIPHASIADSKFADLKDVLTVWDDFMQSKSSNATDILFNTIQCVLNMSRNVFAKRACTAENVMNVLLIGSRAKFFTLFDFVKQIVDSTFSSEDVRVVMHFIHWIFHFISEEEEEHKEYSGLQHEERDEQLQKQSLSEMLTYFIVIWPYHSHLLPISDNEETESNCQLMKDLVSADVQIITENKRRVIHQQLTFTTAVIAHSGHEIQFQKEETCFD